MARLASLIFTACVLLTSVQGQSQSAAAVWEAGQRAISNLAGADSLTVVRTGQDIPGGSEAYGQLLWAHYLHEYGHPDQALAVCNAMDVESLDMDEAFWHAYTSLNYLVHNTKYAQAHATGVRMMHLAEEMACPVCLAAAQLEWGVQLQEDYNDFSAYEMGLKGKRAAAALESPFYMHLLLARSITLIQDRDTVQTADLLLRPALDYLQAEDLKALAARVMLNLAQNEGVHYNTQSAFELIEQARDLYVHLDNQGALCDLGHMYGVLLFYEGNPLKTQAAIDSLDAAFACMDTNVNPGLACQNRICRAQLEYYSSDEGGLESVPFFEEALVFAEMARDDNSYISGTDFLIYIWADSDDPDRAPRCEALFKRMSVVLANIQAEHYNVRAAMLNRADYEVLNLQKELEQSEREKAESQANTLWVAAVGLAIVLGLGMIGWLQYRKRQAERLEAAHAMREQSELKSQREVEELVARHRYDNLLAGIQGEEQERERIAQELHDNIGGSLGIIAAQFESEGPMESAERQQIGTQLRGIYEDLRSLSHTLNLPDTQHNTLVELTHVLLDNLRRAGKLETKLTVFPIDRPLNLPAQVEIQVYRVLQELSNNALKHADAQNIEVNITRTTDSLSVIFEDDGKGFDSTAAAEGIGLTNISNRLEALQATLSIDAVPGRGAIFSFELPLS